MRMMVKLSGGAGTLLEPLQTRENDTMDSGQLSPKVSQGSIFELPRVRYGPGPPSSTIPISVVPPRSTKAVGAPQVWAGRSWQIACGWAELSVVSGPKITIIGGGSRQWAPTLIEDIANTESLRGAHIALEDINPDSLDIVADYVRHVASVAGLELSVSTTTDQREALDGADFVVVTITTGGFESMRADREIPMRYGIRQTVVDGGPNDH